MKTMIPPQVGMRLRTLQKEKKEKKEKGQKEKKKGQRKKRKNKMIKKERRDNATLSFSTLVLQNSTIFMIESLICRHFHKLVGIFRYRTWLVYSNDGLPQSALGLREQASWMHPT